MLIQEYPGGHGHASLPELAETLFDDVEPVVVATDIVASVVDCVPLPPLPVLGSTDVQPKIPTVISSVAITLS